MVTEMRREDADHEKEIEEVGILRLGKENNDSIRSF